MTTITPRDVWYEYEAELFHPVDGFAAVQIKSFQPSTNVDRVPFCAGTVVLRNPSAAAWAMLDSRTEHPRPRLFFRAHHMAHDEDGDPYIIDSLPRVGLGDGNQTGELIVRRVVRDRITGDTTVDVLGREIMMEDKRRIAEDTNPTGATDVDELVQWSLNDVFGSFTITADPVLAATALPDGDRRRMLQGETHSQLIEAELSAIGCRLYDQWGRRWHAAPREDPPTYSGAPTVVKIAALTQADDDTLPDDVDPIVIGITETFESGGDWADGVLVKGTYTDEGGTRHEWYQRSGGGINSRGRVINVERAEPVGNLADEFVSRTIIRGHNITVTARARFDVLPGMTLEVYLRDGEILTGSIRGVEWDLSDTAGTMTIEAQSGEPIE